MISRIVIFCEYLVLCVCDHFTLSFGHLIVLSVCWSCIVSVFFYDQFHDPVTLWRRTCTLTRHTPTVNTMSSSWSELLTGIFLLLHFNPKNRILLHFLIMTGCNQCDLLIKKTKIHQLSLLLGHKIWLLRHKLLLFPSLPPRNPPHHPILPFPLGDSGSVMMICTW